jgi:colanic acid biosynthesis glycosyl transferase WcaI
VEVLCSRRSYDGGGEYPREESRDGVRVRRVDAFAFGRRGAGRAVDYLSFLLAAGVRSAVSRQRHDLTLCLSTPPYVGWVLPRALGRRAGAVAHWVMDLYPDVLTAHGGLRAGGVFDGALRGLTRRQLRGSALVLTLGTRMEERVRAHAGSEGRVECVPLWAPSPGGVPSPETVAGWRQSRGWSPEDLVLLYSGNMGLGHRMGEFLEASGASRRDGVVWAFAGGGARRREVELFVAEHPGGAVQLLPYVRQEDVLASLAAADVHLVSLRSPWQGLIVPSKVQAAFGLGRPVIFVGPRDSEPADWIGTSGGGWIVGEGDVPGLLAAVSRARDPAERQRRGEAALAFARVHFDRERNTGRLADLLEEAAGERPMAVGR